MSNKNVTNILTDILILISRKNWGFVFSKNEGENYIKYEIKEKNVEINIFDHEDSNLENLLIQKHEELKKLFN